MVVAVDALKANEQSAERLCQTLVHTTAQRCGGPFPPKPVQMIDCIMGYTYREAEMSKKGFTAKQIIKKRAN